MNSKAFLSFADGKTPSVREGIKARGCVSTLKLNNRDYNYIVSHIITDNEK